MRGRSNEPVPVGRPLDRLLRHLKAPRARTITNVFTEWPSIAGPQIAAHAQPIRLRDGELMLEVDDAMWASQLKWYEADLLARLRETDADLHVDRIRYRLRRQP